MPDRRRRPHRGLGGGRGGPNLPVRFQLGPVASSSLLLLTAVIGMIALGASVVAVYGSTYGHDVRFARSRSAPGALPRAWNVARLAIFGVVLGIELLALGLLLPNANLGISHAMEPLYISPSVLWVPEVIDGGSLGALGIGVTLLVVGRARYPTESRAWWHRTGRYVGVAASVVVLVMAALLLVPVHQSFSARAQHFRGRRWVRIRKLPSGSARDRVVDVEFRRAVNFSIQDTSGATIYEVNATSGTFSFTAEGVPFAEYTFWGFAASNSSVAITVLVQRAPSVVVASRGTGEPDLGGGSTEGAPPIGAATQPRRWWESVTLPPGNARFPSSLWGKEGGFRHEPGAGEAPRGEAVVVPLVEHEPRFDQLAEVERDLGGVVQARGHHRLAERARAPGRDAGSPSDGSGSRALPAWRGSPRRATAAPRETATSGLTRRGLKPTRSGPWPARSERSRSRTATMSSIRWCSIRPLDLGEDDGGVRMVGEERLGPFREPVRVRGIERFESRVRQRGGRGLREQEDLVLPAGRERARLADGVSVGCRSATRTRAPGRPGRSVSRTCSTRNGFRR